MATKKTTALIAATSAAYDATLAFVETPSGTPASKKIIKKNFLKLIATSEASSATPTINVDQTDLHRITALAVAITSMTTNLSGTPTHGQKLIIEILDNGTAKAITWGASFRSTNVSLPTTTTANKLLRVGLMYDSVDSKFDCVAVAEEA